MMVFKILVLVTDDEIVVILFMRHVIYFEVDINWVLLAYTPP